MTNHSPSTTAAAPRIAAAALALGAFAQLAQILVFREIMAICHGTEIIFGIVLAAGLVWTALGTLVAVRTMRRPAATAPERLRNALAVLASTTGLLLAFEIILARALAGWGAEAAGQAVSLSRAAALSLVVSAPAAILNGAMFAMALRLAPPARFSSLYRAESWGAVAAGLGFTFLLVHFAPPIHAALGAGLVMAAAGWLILRPPATWSRAAIAAVAGMTLVFAALPLELATQALAWHGLLPGYELREVRETPYGRVAALARPGSPQVSLYESGALVASLEPGASTSGTRPLADFCAALHPAPRRALVVGGGLGTMPEELARHGLDEVSAVELDPALFELARAYRGAGADPPHVARVAADGRAFVKRAAPGAYDLILISMGEPDTATVNRYYTLEFFRECRRAMADGGILVLVLPTYGGGTDYTGESLAARSACIWRTLREAFGEVRAAPISGFLFAAAKHAGAITFDPAELGRRLAARPAAAPMSPVTENGVTRLEPIAPDAYFEGLFGGVLAVQQSLDAGPTQERVAALEKVLAETPAALNRDEHPVAVAESLVLSAEVSGGTSRGPTLADVLHRGARWTVGVPLVATLLVSLTIFVRKRAGAGGSRRSALLLAAFATGLFGMALTVGLLAAYQNVRGYVYQEIGALMACFMVGLALGAWGVQPVLGRARELAGRAALFSVMAAMIGLAMALPAVVGALAGLASGAAAAAGFWALVLAVGFIDGAALPLLVSSGAQAEDERFGGRVYAFDLAGAALGALVCGGMWIPLFGLAGAMPAVAALIAAAALALLAL